MIFKSLFKPKWKNKNPQVRRQALRDMDPSLTENQEIFRETLENDPDPVVRQTVLRQLNDLSLLSKYAKSDADATVREHTVQRLRRLLTGNESDSPAIEERLAFLQDLEDNKLLEFVARHAKEASLRESLIVRLDRDALYGDVALQDSDPDLRLTALSRITQRTTLERVLKGARTKDKRVRLAAQERLNAIKADEERPEQLKKQAKQLCARLDSLLVALKAEPDSIRLRTQRQEIDKEWGSILQAWRDELSEVFDEKLNERYQRACEAADELLKGYAEQIQRQAEAERAYEPVRKEREEIYAQLNDTLTKSESTTTVDANLKQEISQSLEQAEQRWNNAGELPAEEARKTNQAFNELTSKLHRRVEDVQRYIDADKACDTVINKGSGEAKKQLDKTLRQVEKLWKEIEKPHFFKFPEEKLSQAEAVLNELRGQKNKNEEARAKALSGFQQKLSKLEKALADGNSKQAASHVRQISNSIKALSSRDIKTLRDSGDYARFQRASGQVKELRDWQGWASHPIREDLCSEVESLAEEIETCGTGPAYDFHAASKKIQNARHRWKSLGPIENEDRALWDRFNEACNRAYEPCQKYFDQEAETRENNFSDKQALCAELEAYYSEYIEGKDELSIDWKQLDRTIATGLQRWRKIGSVRRKAHTEVKERFNDIIQKLKAVLKAERDRNKDYKESLIENAEKVAAALAESDKSAQVLRDSAAAIKMVQANWKEIGYATDEKKLWTRFRAACDSVFNERQAQFDFMTEERKGNLKKKETLCELVERLSDLTGEELKNAKERIAEVKAEWKEVGEVPNESGKAIESRFAELCKRYDRAVQSQLLRDQAEARQVLYQKHELCVQLDVLADEFLNQQVEKDEANQRVETVQKTWSEIVDIAQDAEVSNGLYERYQLAIASLGHLLSQEDAAAIDVLRAEQARNLENKREWCLAMEILAGVESPSEYEQERMALQVQMLAHKHGQEVGADAQLTESITEIENKWFTTGSPQALETVQLERRFAQARETLLASGNADSEQTTQSVSA